MMRLARSSTWLQDCVFERPTTLCTDTMFKLHEQKASFQEVVSAMRLSSRLLLTDHCSACLICAHQLVSGPPLKVLFQIRVLGGRKQTA